MKKQIRFIIVLLAFSLCITSFVYANTPDFPVAGKGNSSAKTTSSESTAPSVYGRFVIPSYNISVSLYNGNSQSIVDAEDSAAFFNHSKTSGMIIVDHHHQNFWDLPYVTVGTEAQIQLNNGGIIYITCVESFAGKNMGITLTDMDGRSILGSHDYLTYTCLPGAGNIHVCQWEITNAQGIDPQYDNSFIIDSRTKSKVASYSVPTQTSSAKTKKGKNK